MSVDVNIGSWFRPLIRDVRRLRAHVVHGKTLVVLKRQIYHNHRNLAYCSCAVCALNTFTKQIFDECEYESSAHDFWQWASNAERISQRHVNCTRENRENVRIYFRTRILHCGACGTSVTDRWCIKHYTTRKVLRRICDIWRRLMFCSRWCGFGAFPRKNYLISPSHAKKPQRNIIVFYLYILKIYKKIILKFLICI